MTPAQQRWDGPIQQEIRAHDAQLGHRPANPYARIEDDGDALPSRVVTVDLPEFEEPQP